ncbi:MAG: trypsin-like peptidase domain-containing protein [Candidatus Magnetomorum sp.]|nr:trypsin-like peptidase domain-containing protein [Candidatus Magnetomorum sp.]
MKKNKQFKINTINNLFWPSVILVVLVIAAIWTNAGIVQNTTLPGTIGMPKPQNQAQIIGTPPVQSQGASPVTALMVQEGISHVVSQVRPSVVGISRQSTTQQQSASGLGYIQSYNSNSKSVGSGVIIDPRGYIVTSFQTIGKDQIVQITLFSNGSRKYPADLVAVDPDTDIAILKIRSQEIFPSIQAGNSDLLEVGDIVFAIGCPFGFSGTVTMGIVSSNNRNVNVNGVRYPDLIQTDASINEGNDGGPLVNIKGEVIGINMASFKPHDNYSGIGFAVPLNDIMAFMQANIF